MTRRVCAFAVVLFAVAAARAQGDDNIVLYTADVTAVHGNWGIASDASGAGGQKMASADNGWSSTTTALAAPNDYFEATFAANANTPYHVWLRMKAAADSKWNDSVYVQFNDARDVNGSAIYTIGTTDALVVNLERCSGCGESGWGWQDHSWWLSQSAVVRFSSTGTHTVRVQTREDGVQIDQIVLSPTAYLSSSPGAATNDSTIVPKPAAASTASTASTSSTLSPYLGTPVSIPGTVEAENFDNGGEGVAYHDTTAGNSGGAYRSTGVDIEASSGGGYDVGWIAAGEWLNYTINVTATGSYTAQLRVASPSGGGSLHLGFNSASSVWKAVSVPATGGWQNWTTVSVPVTLGAGKQQMTLLFDTSGFNIGAITISAASSTSSGGSGGSSSLAYSGTPAPIPGTVEAENFDTGGSGVSYGDTTSGNSGGAYRQTDVDIENKAGGGYDVGWIASGEWLNYTVNVTSSGNYTAQLRVASPSGGGALHIGFNGSSKVWTAVSVPSTGGWQTWATVNVPVTLGAGTQVMTLMFDAGGFNLDSINVVAGTTAPPPPPPPPPPSTGKVRVMTWNVQSGKDLYGTYNPWAQVQLMAAQKPDVIFLEEVETWMADEPTLFKSYLQQITGQTWYSIYAPNTPNAGTIGDLLLSRYPISQQNTIIMQADPGNPSDYLGNRGAARALINIGGVPINFIATHLEHDNTSYRTTQLNILMPWAQSFGGPRLVGGDFNSWWGEWWITQMETQYHDTWLDITGVEDGGYTRGSVRFDYLFRANDSSWRLTPLNVWVVDTTASDHRPVVADYQIQ